MSVLEEGLQIHKKCKLHLLWLQNHPSIQHLTRFVPSGVLGVCWSHEYFHEYLENPHVKNPTLPSTKPGCKPVTREEKKDIF